MEVRGLPKFKEGDKVRVTNRLPSKTNPGVDIENRVGVVLHVTDVTTREQVRYYCQVHLDPDPDHVDYNIIEEDLAPG